MFDHCIIYFYPLTNYVSWDVVQQNYGSHRKNNPDSPIVPITFVPTRQAIFSLFEEFLPDTYFADIPKELYRKTFDPVLFADYALWMYARSKDFFPAERYIFMDWDTYSYKTPIKDFLNAVWNADVGGPSMGKCCPASFFWCGNWCSCNEDIYYFDTFSLALFSHKAVEALREFDWNRICDGFAEAHGMIRIPTAAKRLGLDIRGYDGITDQLSYDGREAEGITQPGIYHSIRTIVNL